MIARFETTSQTQSQTTSQDGHSKKEFSMKNKIKFLGLIAFVMIIGLSFFSCNLGGEVGGGSGGSGTVYKTSSYYYDSVNKKVYLRYGTWRSSSNGITSSGTAWSNGVSLIANEFSSVAIKPETTYAISISGTVDKALINFLVSLWLTDDGYYFYSSGGVSSDPQNIPAGAFNRTFTVTSSRTSQQKEEYFIVLLRNEVSDGSITEGSFATISNFSMTITEVH